MMPCACACFMVQRVPSNFFGGMIPVPLRYSAAGQARAGHYGLIWLLGLLVPLPSTWGFIWGVTPLLRPLPENCSRWGCVMNDFAFFAKFGPTSSLGAL